MSWSADRGATPPVPSASAYYINRKFRRALKRSEIEKCKLHDIRSTVGTRLAEVDVNQAITAKFLGHNDIATTAKYYQKIRREVLRATLEKLNAATDTM